MSELHVNVNLELVLKHSSCFKIVLLFGDEVHLCSQIELSLNQP